MFAGEGHMYVIVGRYGAGCWEWNSGLLQEQYVLLTTERLLEMQSWVWPFEVRIRVLTRK